MSLRCWSIWVYRTRRPSGETASPPAASAGGAEQRGQRLDPPGRGVVGLKQERCGLTGDIGGRRSR